MSASKIEITTGMCVVALTKYIMCKYNLDYETSYKKLLTSELYQLLQDAETRLFLETNEYLYEAYDKETELGTDALYEFINDENI
ncbi:MAG: hypothetical protein ACI4CT_04630 [Lachnospiraceae bacterium]